MKFAVVVLACVLATVNAQFPNNRASAFASFGNFPKATPRRAQPYKAQPAYKPYNFKPSVTVTPQPEYVSPVPVVPVANARYNGDASASDILKFGNEIQPDGGYSYYYETSNGIAAQQQGTPRNFGGNPPVVPDVAQGSFSWTSPEGIPIAITYVADENGYQPQGAAIPTPPPVPAQIARALEYIARSAPRK